ncbi:MAG: DUF3426 domain-containing protein [Betaproteobacteria bacterium]
MKTRCPTCQTVFRVTSEQLKARSGKVRCGQCQVVFNALDHLLENTGSAALTAPSLVTERPAPQVLAPVEVAAETEVEILDYPSDPRVDILLEPLEPAEAVEAPEHEAPIALSETEAQTLGKATGLILPRETTEIPGYSKWTEGVMTAPFSQHNEKRSRWPFILAAILLIIALAGQIVFRFRSDIAVAAPLLRSSLEALSQALDTTIPLPRHVDLVSIEASDLQTDAANGNLLVLNATLRNRANYAQELPFLELSLTDTHDATLARRVFAPGEYLSSRQLAEEPFVANADIAVRLWIEAKDMTAAGYRLYVFYP